MYAGIVQTVQSLHLPTASKHTVRGLKEMRIINAAECGLTGFFGMGENNPDGSSSIRRWKKLYGLACDRRLSACVEKAIYFHSLPRCRVCPPFSSSEDTQSKSCCPQVTFSGGGESAPRQKFLPSFTQGNTLNLSVDHPKTWQQTSR